MAKKRRSVIVDGVSQSGNNYSIRSGNIGPSLGSRDINSAPNRNLNSQQFHSARSYEQQRLF